MPLFYTHIRYANKCLDLLADEYKKIVENNYVYFLCGTQGPNIFKYHSPVLNIKYIELSNSIHSNSITNLLKHVKDEFNSNKNRDEILSYTFGYITHFVLDSYTDSYLFNSSIKLNIDKDILKSEIEKYYLNKDKINSKNIFNKFKYSQNISNTISKILNIKENIIKQSLENMIQYSKILYINNNKILDFIIKLTKFTRLKRFNNLFIYNAQIKHTAQILRFEKYFEISKFHCLLLINNFIDFIFNDIQLDSFFFNTFELKNNDPVLEIKDEKNYIINSIKE